MVHIDPLIGEVLRAIHKFQRLTLRVYKVAHFSHSVSSFEITDNNYVTGFVERLIAWEKKDCFDLLYWHAVYTALALACTTLGVFLARKTLEGE